MTDNQRTVDRYFTAMRIGADAADEMLSLFTDDAVYTEPFSGIDEPAIGVEAIRDRLHAGWSAPLPDMELDVLSVEIDGDRGVARWECRSPAFPGPMQGRDTYEFENGRIRSLTVTLAPPPDLG